MLLFICCAYFKFSNKTGHHTNSPKRTRRSNGLCRTEAVDLGLVMRSNKSFGVSATPCFGASHRFQTMVAQAVSVPASASFTIASHRRKTPSQLVFSQRFIFLFPNTNFIFFLFACLFLKSWELNRYFTRNPCSIASSLPSPYGHSSKVGNFLI